jgi:hypothetical protein
LAQRTIIRPQRHIFFSQSWLYLGPAVLAGFEQAKKTQPKRLAKAGKKPAWKLQLRAMAWKSAAKALS